MLNQLFVSTTILSYGFRIRNGQVQEKVDEGIPQTVDPQDVEDYDEEKK